ncbi:hypothetical protein LI328DRAFT_22120 [Trichoderma asperelloides]|nr:hypothetical protein LI328DRAFT_22120 [Trichoderma asperelloides]
MSRLVVYAIIPFGQIRLGFFGNPLLVGVGLEQRALRSNDRALIASLAHAVRRHATKSAMITNVSSGCHYCDTNATRSLARNPPSALAPVSASPETASCLDESISLRPETNSANPARTRSHPPQRALGKTWLSIHFTSPAPPCFLLAPRRHTESVSIASRRLAKFSALSYRALGCCVGAAEVAFCYCISADPPFGTKISLFQHALSLPLRYSRP